VDEVFEMHLLFSPLKSFKIFKKLPCLIPPLPSATHFLND
jgi:hypothetical protein